MLTDNDVATIDGFEDMVGAQDTATLHVESGASVAFMFAYDNSTINVHGGDIAWLQMYGNSVANIYSVDELSWIIVDDDSVVNIFGTGFSYTMGQLSGSWRDGNSFTFHAIHQDKVAVDDFNNLPDNFKLHQIAVPEPLPLRLFLIGVLVISLKSRFAIMRGSF